MTISLVRAAMTALASLALLTSMNASVGIADDSWKAALERKTISDDSGSLDYRLLTPPKSDSGDEKQQYPLVLFLHGAGERGSDNEAQLVHGVGDFYARRATHPAFVVAPQCPEGQRWVEVDWSDESGKNSFPDKPSEPMRLALKIIDQLVASGRVDQDRIYVTGLSMGGYGTWYAAGFKGHPFAAAAPICGGGDPSWAERYVGLPLWAFHGDADKAVPVERSREMIEAIREAGGEPKYTEYPGVGHNSWSQTYSNDAFHEWLFAQKR
ncbi:carboxylesterase family protein [Candidatus Laterigemmans baculatus]|uniref:carboxylesterase family protein n=1 Tax=Candidatus Laterigemmans baculatus TaxID=2770505 RepID=UPI0013D98C65|nr:prolyl oligopeptidase family serine peptidase [Candidatus Laterigemmans baculatus]